MVSVPRWVPVLVSQSLRPIVPPETHSRLQRVVATQHVLWSPSRTALRTPCFKIILKHIHFVLRKELSARDAVKLLQPGRSNKNHFIPKHNRNLLYNCFLGKNHSQNHCFPIGALHFKPRTEMKLPLSQFTKAQTYLSPLSFSLKLEQSQTCTYPNKH